MLIPSRTKFRKVHRLTHEGRAKGNTTLTKGEFGIQALTGAWITSNQIEAARVAMNRYMSRGGKVYINIFEKLFYRTLENVLIYLRNSIKYKYKEIYCKNSVGEDISHRRYKLIFGKY